MRNETRRELRRSFGGCGCLRGKGQKAMFEGDRNRKLRGKKNRREVHLEAKRGASSQEEMANQLILRSEA